MKSVFKKISLLFLLLLTLRCLEVRSQILINEVFASNASQYMDMDIYNFSNVIELYNTSNSTLDLLNYSFTNDKLQPFKYKINESIYISAGGYLLLIADEANIKNHLNFKIKSKSSHFAIRKPDGTISDSLTYPKQITNTSWGRYPDGASSFQYFSTPSIKKANESSTASKAAKTPKASIIGGDFKDNQTIVLSSTDAGVEIFFTTDGTEPSRKDSKYTLPISIAKTTVLRAVAFGSNLLRSEVMTQTYFIGERKKNLPVLSIVTPPKFMFDDYIGIYVAGLNGVQDKCSDGPKNWNRNWERPANFEMIDTIGKQVFNQYVGMDVSGNCSRNNSMKSLGIKAKDKYGKNELKYKFFKDKNAAVFANIYIHNSGNDFGITMFRDAFIQNIMKKNMTIDYQEYQPSVVYINGAYWGIMNIREKINEDFVTSNYGYDSDSIDFLENNNIVHAGDFNNWNSLYDFVQKNSLAEQAKYEFVKSKIDLDEYIDFTIAEIYCGNTDWPGNNMKYWRKKSADAKWRWVLQDTDFGFGLWDARVDHNTLAFALEPNGPYWPNPDWSTLLFRRLNENEAFKTAFVTRFMHHLNTTFLPSRINALVDSLAGNIRSEMPYHIQKWGGSMYEWERNVNVLKDYGSKRPELMKKFLRDQYFNGAEILTRIMNQTPERGTIVFKPNNSTSNDSLLVRTQNDSITIEAKPSRGFEFVKWEKQKAILLSNQAIIPKNSNWKYFYEKNEPQGNWRTISYDDNNWKDGKAELGYGDGGEQTTLNYGGNDGEKFITAYFRKSFIIDNDFIPDILNINLLRDDGAVVYLNGETLFKHNLSPISIYSNTLADQAVGGSDETKYFNEKIPISKLKKGENVIAVEVHQSSVSSSDMSFDLELVSTALQGSTKEFVTTGAIKIKASENLILNAIFRSQLPFINVSSQNVTTDQKANNKAFFSIYAYGAWTVSSAEPWLTSNSTSGEDDAKIQLIVQENTSGAAREAIVRVNAPGVGSYDIKVTQTAVTGIETLELEKKIFVYPNPSRSYVKINLQKQIKTKVRLIASNGTIVLSCELENTEEAINIGGLKPGLYLLEAIQEGAVFKTKIVID